ncbi:hypothetical protein NE237_001454 [Protea cynaroides]|uniref:Uncharacterized protein n=1 Tax=Protea cynaroides TaxID=273540 RepID=A0A9Q0QY42_9MAGN|nr:hypothetical protein NE237_001454 [Protea cynaroides]
MATTLLKLNSIPSLFIIVLVLILQSHIALSLDFPTDTDEDDSKEYVVDTGSRYLLARIRKGAHCNLFNHNICDGIPVNNGTGLLHCCKKHCRNILSDKNNCGRCGRKCGFGQRCCHGFCTNVAFNGNHCGKCNRKCLPGIKCEFGSCGYA